MTRTDPQPFLSRWAQRKAANQADQVLSDDEVEPLQDPDQDAENLTTQAENEAELSDEELLARHELPDPQSCTDPKQLDAFFKNKTIPDRLRHLAIRRIWRIDPAFRFADEMVEYGEDFTDAATVIPNMQTAYKVGKGYLDKILAEQDQAKLEQLAEQAADEPAPVEGSQDSEQRVEKSSPASEHEVPPKPKPEDDKVRQAEVDTARRPRRPEARHTEHDTDGLDSVGIESVRQPISELPVTQADESPNTSAEDNKPVFRPRRMVFVKNPA